MFNDNRFKTVTSFEELKTLVEEDKNMNGMGAATANRYPIRFVLFDNFKDSYEFVMYMQSEREVAIQSVDKWIDKDYPDLMITYQELSEHISEYIASLDGRDSLITPFSELARFYDNQSSHTFDALIKTLKSIEASWAGVECSQRIYIPIIGLEGKMSAFENDTQINVWRLHDEETSAENYTMILVKDASCYGVKKVEEKANVVHTVGEWLDIWKKPEVHQRRTIVSTSKSIFANAKFAQPDNAFTYVTPQNTFEFLKLGLRLDFGDMAYHESDEENWRLLAEQIDLSKEFDLNSFVSRYFDVNDLSSYKSFLKIWFAHSSKFDRWLLCSYYQMSNLTDEFLATCLSKMKCYSNADLFTEIATYTTSIKTEMDERRDCLNEAALNHVTLTENVEVLIGKRLESVANQFGHHEAIKYFSGITHKEKELAIAWLGKGHIQVNEVKAFFPELFDYMQSQPLLTPQNLWLSSYFDNYKKAKLGNVYTQEIKNAIAEHNADSVSFDTWYQKQKTTGALLANRSDIEVYYWIVGLGVEWISFVQAILAKLEADNLYLNETMVARALLPTTTEVNKKELQRLSDVDIQTMKVGDLDALAHKQGNKYPDTIISEMEIVQNAIETIISKYAGKKIAIVSDHGLTYLSQLQEGLNLAGFESDHHGRLAVCKSGKATQDKNYIVLDDGKTVCALTHKSLCSKVPRDQGIHGGCTPEEVLVPIFVVSSNPSNCHWSVVLLTPEVSATDPIVKLQLKGLSKTDTPYIIYNNKSYQLTKTDEDEFTSERLEVDENVSDIRVLVSGTEIGIHTISWKMGAQEEDLFDF